MSKPQHLTGSEELDDLLRSMWPSNDPRDQFRYEKDKEAILSWHTKHLAKARLEARADELIKAAPHQVANFFQLKASDLTAGWYLEYVKLRDAELKRQLASMEGTDDK